MISRGGGSGGGGGGVEGGCGVEGCKSENVYS